MGLWAQGVWRGTGETGGGGCVWRAARRADGGGWERDATSQLKNTRVLPTASETGGVKGSEAHERLVLGVEAGIFEVGVGCGRGE